jgi:hypothetical protein
MGNGDRSKFITSDLSLAATISLWFPIDLIDKTNPGKVLFLFKREFELDKLLEGYWRGELRVEPKMYFASLRSIKSRLYGEA